jgi:hypothetical protein
VAFLDLFVGTSFLNGDLGRGLGNGRIDQWLFEFLDSAREICGDNVWVVFFGDSHWERGVCQSLS